MTISEQPDINTLFRNLEKWRHFAGYPLEPRADAFFGLFLPKVIDEHYGVGGMHPQVIPQFPLKQEGDRRCNKVDFLALSADKAKAFLVEIKTDKNSTRDSQLEYLLKARASGMDEILKQFKDIVDNNSRSYKKYLHLTFALSELGLLQLDEDLKEEMAKDKPSRLNRLKSHFRVCDSTPSRIKVVFVQPEESPALTNKGFDSISLNQFAGQIEGISKLGSLFAEYLKEWETNAGERFPLT